MNEFVEIIADKEIRLDKAVSGENLTRNKAAILIESGNCTVNSAVVTSKKHIVKIGDVIALEIPEAEPADILPEDIPLDVRYEDADVIVINKPRGMIVHPASGVYSGTLVNALMFHCGDSLSGINGVVRPGIVHRIDKDTSGLLVVAKNDFSHVKLAEQLKAHTVTREYEAVVHGRIKCDGWNKIDAPIGRSVSDRKKMCVTAKNSRNAVTEYSVIAEYERYTHLRLKLQTGRTHQIRVHMAYLGHSVAGDSVYGNSKPQSKFKLNGQCLHARKLGFVHPRAAQNDEYIEIISELPKYFEEFLNEIR